MFFINLIYLIMILVVIYVYIVAIRNHSSKISNIFILFMFVQLLINFSSIFLIPIESATLIEWFISVKVKNIALSFLPIIWVLFMYEYLGVRYNKLLLYLFGIVSFLLFLSTMMKSLDFFVVYFFKSLVSNSFTNYLTNFTTIDIAFVLITLISLSYTSYLYWKRIQDFSIEFNPQILIITVLVGLLIVSEVLIVEQVVYSIDVTLILSFLTTLLFYRIITDNTIKNVIPISNSRIIDNLPTPVLILNNKNTILYANLKALDEIDFLETGKKLYNIPSIVNFNRNDKLVDSETFTVKHFENSELSTYIVNTEIFNDNHRILMLQDATYDHEKLKNLHKQSMVDNLTGLLNKSTFYSVASKDFHEYISKNKLHAVAMLDLDHFKSINDNYGHQIGDEVLVALASDIRKVVKETDIIARFGGEEFCALLQYDTPEEILNCLETFKNLFSSRKFMVGGVEFNVTISIGVILNCNEVFTIEKMMELADQALYDSKNSGRDKITVSDYTKIWYINEV